MASEHKTRATIRHSGDYILVLCPLGHLLEAHKISGRGALNYAGSHLEAELARLHPGDRFGRMAARCNGAGH